jgi:hypothetical protein
VALPLDSIAARFEALEIKVAELEAQVRDLTQMDDPFLSLSNRAKHALAFLCIRSGIQLKSWNDRRSELKRLPSLGKLTYSEVCAWLDRNCDRNCK